MSVFLVYVRDEDENKPAVRMEWTSTASYDPPEPFWCAEPIVADTRAQAKYRFLQKMVGPIRNPVYWDDWPLLRVRLLTHNDEIDYNTIWLRIHELLDHNNKPCDCEYLEHMEAV